MKSFFSRLLITLGIVIATQSVAQSQTFEELQHGNSGYGTLGPGSIVYWKYRVPANTIGFFTLKNTGRRSNFDIYSSLSPQFANSNIGDNPGLQTELLIMDASSRREYFYIAIVNNGRQASEYRLHADYVDPVNRLFMAAVEVGVEEWLTRGQNPEASENVGRAVTAISSMLQGSSFGGVGRDLLIRESTSYVRDQFGYGPFGDVVVNWTASMISGFYRYYP